MSEEYEEVYDFKKIFIVIGIAIAIVIAVGLIITFDLEKLLPDGIISDLEFEIKLPEFTEREIPPTINEIIKKGDESPPLDPFTLDPFSHLDTPMFETRTQNELLIIEFIRFGLEEEDITDVLTDDCSNYQNSTSNESRFQKLFDVKKELCFGIEGE